jgi:hypothetical protein
LKVKSRVTIQISINLNDCKEFFYKKSLQNLKALWFYFLFENIKNENEFEIKPAINQERIQKNKKLERSAQLILAKVNVIKNVVMQFCRN